MNMIFADGSIGTIQCLGSLEEESSVLTVTKKCRGVVAKSRTKGTGNGTIKLSMHVPWALYVKAMGMEDEGLADGVYGYGRSSMHPEVALTADVFDEDDVEKFKAWPRCVFSAGPARKVENGAEEVAEVEAEMSYMPDEYGFGMYEALADELDANIKGKWMAAFTPSLMQKVSA